MRTKIDSRVPRYSRLITPTFNALRSLGEYGIGVKEIKSYEIDEDFFRKI